MPQRQSTGRKLALNHSNALPRYVIAYDSETFPTPMESTPSRLAHQFRLGVAISARIVHNRPESIKLHRFTTTAQFWAFVHNFTGCNYTTWLIAHNAMFDMVVSGMPEQFEQAKLVIEWPRSRRKGLDENDPGSKQKALCIIDSPPTIIACKSTESNGRIVIVDTLNWFPMPLRDIGESMQLPKLEMPRFEESDTAWFNYCRRDTEIVFRAFTELLRWTSEHELGMFRYTGPSQSMAAYRHKYMDRQLYIHDNAECKRLERLAYFGGRTEVFKLGNISETVYQLDVSSLFPSVMQCGQFPYILDTYEQTEDWNDELPDIQYDSAVAEVRLDTREAIFPLRDGKTVLYPTGRFETTLCGQELAYARKMGYIVSIRSWSAYRTDRIFQRFVDHFWAMRLQYKKDGNRLYDTFTKRIMNSLYGKFGQLSPQWVNVPGDISNLPWDRWVAPHPVTGDSTNFRSFGWQVQMQEDRAEIDGTFVAISAFVTSAARMKMNYLRSIAGERNVYYQGVDSLIVTAEGKTRLEAANEIAECELGKLRLQLAVNHGEIFGCSDYRLGEKVVISSRSSNAEQRDDGTFLQRRFTATGFLFCGKSIDTVDEQLVSWQRSAAYTKGDVSPSGWVDPPRFVEGVRMKAQLQLVECSTLQKEELCKHLAGAGFDMDLNQLKNGSVLDIEKSGDVSDEDKQITVELVTAHGGVINFDEGHDSNIVRT